MNTSRRALVEDLRALGVEPGDHLALGTSFKSLGPIEGGPDGFVAALLEAVGPKGTLMAPSFTIPSYVRSNYLFERDVTPAYTGLLPETLRRHPAAVRSLHPTSSVVAVGHLSEPFTRGHLEADDEYLPYARLAEADGKVLSIGIGDRLVSFWHEAQHRAGLLDLVPCGQRVRYRTDGGGVAVYRRTRRAGCTRELRRLLPRLRERALVADGRVARAESILVPARQSLEVMTEELSRTPEINLCGHLTCVWCRHVERELDLYSRLERPRWFQSSKAARGLVALVNAVRRRDIPQVTRFEVAVGKLARRWSAR